MTAEILQREADVLTALAAKFTVCGYTQLALHMLNSKLVIQREIRRLAREQFDGMRVPFWK